MNAEPAGTEPRFRALATSAPVGIYELDPEGECVFVNEHWCSIAGVEAESGLGRGWTTVIHPEDIGAVVREWTRSADERREFALEYRYLRPGGEEVWVTGRAVAVRDDDGEILAYLGTVVDISDSKRAEAELEASEQRYRSTIESVGAVVFRTDAEGRWAFLNRAWTEHTGRSIEDSIGRPFMEAVLEQDLPAVERALAPLADGESESVRYIHRYRGANGEIRWAEASVRRVADPDGATSGYAGTLTDITQRREDEMAMRRLAGIVDSSADAIIGFDVDGIVTSWNPGAERIYGYSAKEMIGRSVEVLVPPGNESELPAILDRLRAGDRVVGLETARTRKDWRQIDVALTISPIRDETEVVVGASSIARDITERRLAERSLEESARHFDLSHDLVATCGFDGFFKRLNGTWEPSLGWSHEDLLQKPLAEIVHADDRAAVTDAIADLARGEAVTEVRLRISTKAGGWRWTEWSASPEVESGVFYASGRDITERLEVERLLEDERRQLAEAQRMARVGSWELDLETGERTWSAQQYRNHGFDPEGPLPDVEEVMACIDPRDLEGVQRMTAAIEEGAMDISVGYRFTLPGGEQRTIEVQGRPFRSADGTTRLIGTSRDVTAERDADRLKDEFFGLISHELRTPLTSIIGYTELLGEIEAGSLSEQGRRFVEVIERNSRRQLRLVGDLLLLTRVTAGTFEIEVGHADVGEIAATMIEAARPLADQAGIEITLETAGAMVAEADPDRVAQVVENLVSNAIKFTSRGGAVAVRVGPSGPGVSFEVADTGIGIAEADLGRLFERMYRSEEAERRHIQGTGLGLTIVKAIVDAHEATIEVESELGAGTTFRVWLPRRVQVERTGDHAGDERAPTYR